jgi:hypothetical protein
MKKPLGIGPAGCAYPPGGYPRGRQPNCGSDDDVEDVALGGAAAMDVPYRWPLVTQRKKLFDRLREG